MAENPKTYLGRVVGVHQKDEYRFAVVEPLLMSTLDRQAWTGRIPKPTESFPTRGLVFWHLAPRDLREGSLWMFEVVPHPAFRTATNRRGPPT